jgi:glycine/D-amino acid oxidase-like deaminating enzyme
MPGYGARYWGERTPASKRRTHPKIKGTHTADVVVIGGGLTGAASAYVLAAGGLDVVLLEADGIASGTTAGSIGAIVPEPDAWFRDAEPAAGRRAARAMWKAAHRGASDMASTLKKLNIRCDLTPAPYVVNARAIAPTDEADGLRRERAARKAAGLVVSGMTAAAVEAETALESAGGLKLTGGSTYDPVRAALGLVAAAQAKGARVFEKSAVRRTTFTRKEAQVVLGDARITTKGIVVATGEPGAPFSQLRRHVRRQTGFVVVTEPLPAAMRREVGRRASVSSE